MDDKIIISVEELKTYGEVLTLSDQAVALSEQQQMVWGLASENYAALQNVETKIFDFAGFEILVQFNAERIRSSAAKTDKQSIAKRACFLCPSNLPVQQKGIMVDEQFVLLCNPYPIFKTHLTISTREHRPQLIKGSFGEMLKLSKALDKFTLFYNGPECGASAPDHFHFQAGNRGFLPIENEIGKIEFQVLVENPEIKVISSDKSLRRFFVFESNNAEVLSRNFLLIYTLLQNWAHSEEPMLNVLCNYIDKKWRVIIFPREKQRPSAYYEKGEKQILVSPASVELGGVIILPRKADFDKITKPDIRKIYDEVTINRDNFDKLNQIIQILVGE